MAGVSLTSLKRRMKSIENLSKITKAMELIASSKLPEARKRFSNSVSYFETVKETLLDVANSNIGSKNIYLNNGDGGKTCFVVISGDRGFAGGYHTSLFRKLREEVKEKDACFFPIGKKACEYFKGQEAQVLSNKYFTSANIGVRECKEIALELLQEYKKSEWNELTIIYMHFDSIMMQTPEKLRILPLVSDKVFKEGERRSVVLYEPSVEEAFERLLPQFLSGVLYGTVCAAYVSEIAARKMAMDSANKNSDDLIASLKLQYNRIRQEAITAEITEITSASEAE